jgi:hypothetical protein
MAAPSIDVLLSSAEEHIRRNNLAEADRISRLILAENPDHPKGLVLAGHIAALQGDLTRTQRVLGTVLQHDPNCVQALCLLGLAHCDHGDARNTLTHVTRGLEIEFGLNGHAGPIEFWRRLVDLVERDAPPAIWRHRTAEISAVAWALQRTGLLVHHSEDVCARLAAVELRTIPAAEAAERVGVLLGLAAFAKSAAFEWNCMLFERVVLPWLKRALAGGLYDAASVIEARILTRYIAQRETEAHFARVVGRWTDEARAAGRRIGMSLAPLTPRKPTAVPRVAFVAHMLSSLAHIRLMLDTLEGHAALPRPLIKPFVYGFRCSWDKDTMQRVTGLGIEVNVSQSGAGEISVGELQVLREYLSAHDIDAIVWISYVHLMPFAFALRLAPVQIWWAMKYHSLELPEIDGYLAFGAVAGGTRQIAGRLWRAGPIAAEDWFDPQLSGKAAQVRATFAKHELLYGCFGREEKLNSAGFLSCVIEVLKAVPNAGFLWTGRTRSPEIQAAFENAGLAERCHYIGWVNTRLYAQVIDAFLDSFPFPCGYTLYEALAAAKPAVLYASAEAAETGLRAFVEPVLDGTAGSADQARAQAIFRPPTGENLYLCAGDPASYVSYAVRLGRDPSFRTRAGAAGADFVRHFMSDRTRLGRIYGEHIAAIVREKTLA